MAEKFCWVELLTGDVEAARDFLREVVGWTCFALQPLRPRLPHFSIDGADVAGLMQFPEEARTRGARPAWMGYISASDVDAEVAAVKSAGGQAFRTPETIPDVGRFAVVADPQGAAYCLWKDLHGRAATEAAADDARPCRLARTPHRRCRTAPSLSTPRRYGWTKTQASTWGRWASTGCLRPAASPSAA